MSSGAIHCSAARALTLARSYREHSDASRKAWSSTILWSLRSKRAL